MLHDRKVNPAPDIAISASIPPSPRKNESRRTSSSEKSGADDEIGVVEVSKPGLTAEDLAKQRMRRREAKKARIIVAKATLESTTDLLNGWPKPVPKDEAALVDMLKVADPTKKSILSVIMAKHEVLQKRFVSKTSRPDFVRLECDQPGC